MRHFFGNVQCSNLLWVHRRHHFSGRLKTPNRRNNQQYSDQIGTSIQAPHFVAFNMHIFYTICTWCRKMHADCGSLHRVHDTLAAPCHFCSPRRAFARDAIDRIFALKTWTERRNVWARTCVPSKHINTPPKYDKRADAGQNPRRYWTQESVCQFCTWRNWIGASNTKYTYQSYYIFCFLGFKTWQRHWMRNKTIKKRLPYNYFNKNLQ